MKGSPEEDPVAHHVIVNAPLREYVQMIQFLDGSMIEKMNRLVYGYLQGTRDAEERDHQAANGA